MQFRQETLAQLRQRVGRLLFPSSDQFQTATLSAGSTTVLTSDSFKLVPDDVYVGKVAYAVSGAAAGQARYIADSTQSAGTVTVNVPYGAAVGAVQVEIWPDYRLPDAIKDALNLAIHRASDIVNVYVETDSPVLDSTRMLVTIPANLVKVVGVRYITGTSHHPVEYSPSLDWWNQHAGPELMVRGSTLYLNQAIPSDATSYHVRGYRLPALLAADADLCEVRPDYLVFMAAAILDMGEVAAQMLDPEASGTRATGWLQQASQIEARMATNWLPDVVPVET